MIFAKIKVPCAIRDCPKMATVNSSEHQNDRFALCEDCETSIVLDQHMTMETMDFLPPKTTANFAVVFNAFRRQRKGASLTHRSGVVTTLKEINVSAPTIIRGN